MALQDDSLKIEIRPWAKNKAFLWPGIAITGFVALYLLGVWMVSLSVASVKIAEKFPALGQVLVDSPESVKTFLPVLNNQQPEQQKTIFGYDLSTVTFYLLFCFSLYLFLGMINLARNKMNVAALSEFPFPQRYRITWVQLGLVGTLWGFLLLGFGLEHKTSDQETIHLLVQSFGTALLSTFTAVVLAYIAAPFFQRLYSLFLLYPANSNAADKASANFVHYLQCLNDELKLTAEILRKSRTGVLTNLSGINKKIHGTGDKIESAIQKSTDQLGSVNKSVQKSVEVLTDIKKVLDKKSEDSLKAINKTNKILSNGVAAVRKQSADIKSALKLISQNQGQLKHDLSECLRTTVSKGVTQICSDLESHGMKVSEISTEVKGLKTDMDEIKKQIGSHQSSFGHHESEHQRAGWKWSRLFFWK